LARTFRNVSVAPRSNTQPVQFAVAEIVPAGRQISLLQKLIAPDTRNALAMTISGA
jgi:hypothetical protein